MNTKLKPVGSQVIVITGASSGIGLATSYAAADQGAKLVLAARSPRVLGGIVSGLERAGAQAVGLVGDVADRSALYRLAEHAIASFGRIDTWVNNAGVGVYGRLDEVTEEDSRRLFDVNFWGVVHGSLAALPHLRVQGGALINVGSELSEGVLPLQGMYCAAKHAVKGFTDALRVEQASVEGPRVSITLMLPGSVDTPFPLHARNYLANEPTMPTPRLDPREVAESILRAATHPTREVHVGFGAKLDSIAMRVIPRLRDHYTASLGQRQQSNRRNLSPLGALHAPSEDGHVLNYREQA
jgi:short-subunit dehydrogenase